jgi:hypothetical protein
MQQFLVVIVSMLASGSIFGMDVELDHFVGGAANDKQVRTVLAPVQTAEKQVKRPTANAYWAIAAHMALRKMDKR